MKIFNSERRSEVTTRTEAENVPEVRSAELGETNSVQSARSTLEAMSLAFRSANEQQQVAVRHMSSLDKTLEKMDAGMRRLLRMETENGVLKNRCEEIDKQLIQKTNLANEQESRLIALERQYKELQKDFSESKAELAVQKDRQTDARVRNTNNLGEIEALKRRVTQSDDQNAALELRNKTLQDELASRRIALSEQKRESFELQKKVENLTVKLDSRTKDRDNVYLELKELRNNYSDINSKFLETSNLLEAVRYDLDAQKTIHEETLRRREADLYALKSQIDQYDTEVRIKNIAAADAEREIRVLQQALDTAQARAEESDSRLRAQTMEFGRNTDALMKTNSEFELLNSKFSAALEDIETLRRVNAAQQDKLERYAAISGSLPTRTSLAEQTAEAMASTGVDDKPQGPTKGTGAKVTQLKSVK